MSRAGSLVLATVAAGALALTGAISPVQPSSAASAATVATDATLTPNPANTGPAFQGWGTSLAWMAEATGSYPAALRADLVDKVFGQDGLRLNIARYNIGGGNASDVRDYLRPGGAVPGWWNPDAGFSDAAGPITTSYADRARYLAAWTGQSDTDYDFSSDASQRAWIDAIKDKVTTWEAFSNSPPYFMTKSGYVSGGTDPNADQIDPAAVTKFATYLKTVAQHVEKSDGISFSSIDPLNEPNTDYWKTTLDAGGKPTGGGQEGAHAGPSSQSQVLAALAAELAKSDTTTKAMVSGPDETNPSTFVSDWNGWSAAAKQDVGRLNVHSYSTANRIQARDIAKSAGKPLWMSEVEGNWGGNSWNPSSIENGLGVAGQITSDLRELEPQAWVLWQPVEDLYNMQNVEKTNWGSVFVDFDCQADGTSARRVAGGDATTKCAVQVNSKYNTIRNFTHYIAPGDHIVPTSDANTTSAVKADGKGAVLVYTNSGDSARTVKVDLSLFGAVGHDATVTPVTTTQSPDDAPTQNALVTGAAVPVDASTHSATMSVPAKSVTTFVVSDVSGVSADAPALHDGEHIRLIGSQSGKALAASGSTTVISGMNGPDAAAGQVWTATRVASGDGTARDRYVLGLADGRVLTATSSGTRLVQLSADDAASDPDAQWMVNTTNGTAFSLVNVGQQAVLDVSGQSTTEGASVGIWTDNGGANQSFSIQRAGGTATFPDVTEDALVAHDFTFYEANSGASSTGSIDGAQLGLYQARSDQPYGRDATTGGSWGYVTSATSHPVAGASTSSTSPTSSLLVDQEPSGATLSSREVAYAFDIPDGTYDVTFGVKLPDSWPGRDEQLRAEGDTLATVTVGSSLTEKTLPVTVTDGRLDVSVHSTPGRTSGDADPAVSYVVVRAQTTWTSAILRAKLADTAVQNRDDYTVLTLAALDGARDDAQALVDAASTDEDAIKTAYSALASAFAALRHRTDPYTSFRPGQEWRDDGGSLIQAHGGQVVPSKDSDGRTIYYLYGEDHTNGYHSSPGVHVYSSYDLYNWTDRGVALRTMSSSDQFASDPYFTALYGDESADQRAAVYRDLGTVQTDPNVNPAILERPKVIYNAKTHQWVMWMHADGPSATSNAQYAKANAGVAVSDSPYGPFKYLGSTRLDHAAGDDTTNKAPSNPGMARDMNLFVDDDGTAYIIYASEENQTMFISKLDDSYTGLATDPDHAVEGRDYRRLFIGWSREAPAMFKYDGTYFLMTSGATGWSPNPAQYATSTSILGPDWSNKGNPFPWWAQSSSWNTQPTSVIPVDPAHGKFIFMGDRWNNGDDLATAQMVWLPVNMGEGGKTFTIEVWDDWKLTDLDQWAAWDVTDPPTSLQLGKEPSADHVTVRQNGVETSHPVTWTTDGSIDQPGVVTITGTIADMGSRTFTRTVPVLPSGIRYAVNAGGQQTADWKAIMAAARAAGPVFNTAADQPYGKDAVNDRSWGYQGEHSGTYGDDTGDLFDTLRYAVSGQDLDYRFTGLQPGDYTVYAGYDDPWSWDDRGADVTINGGLVEHDHDYANAYQTNAYSDVKVGADGVLTFSLSPTRAHDVQLSWLMISDPRPVDYDAPALQVAASPSAPDGADGWYRDPVQITAKADDPSGVASVEFRSAGQSEWSSYDGPIDVYDGTTNLQFRATDTRGNVTTTRDVDVKRDSEAPESELETAPGREMATVTLSADDAGSGVASMRYRVDGGDWADYTTPFTVTRAGEHTVEYSATDVAGNVEDMQSATVQVVAQKPSAPAESSAKQLGDASIGVSWSAPGDDGGAAITGYRVYEAGAAQPVCDVAAPVTSCTVKGLELGTAHQYEVSALNSAGEGSRTTPTVTILLPEVASNDGAKTIPGTPVLSSDDGWDTGLKDGDFNVTMNMWSGQNGSLFKLYRDGALVAKTRVAMDSPHAQRASIHISGLSNGTYVFAAVLVNSKGSSVAQPLTVRVTDASPGSPVLSSDNWDGDGAFTLTADLWWGTNATSYTFCEGSTVIGSGSLTAASPQAQRATLAIKGASKGSHKYIVRFANAAGVTVSAPLVVKVTH